MDSESFVDAVKRYVLMGAINDTISMLRKPPGRNPRKEDKIQSEWYNSLSLTDAENVNKAIASAAHASLFGLFVVLDGASKIDDEGGQYELTHVSNKRVILNDPDSIGLHDLLNAVD